MWIQKGKGGQETMTQEEWVIEGWQGGGGVEKSEIEEERRDQRKSEKDRRRECCLPVRPPSPSPFLPFHFSAVTEWCAFACM